MREAPLRDRIAAIRDRLTPAERKVAELVVADLAAIPRATVAVLARQAGVSEPTVIRFCRALGLEGFADLRMAVVRAEAGGGPSAGPPPGPRPGPRPVVAPDGWADSVFVALLAALDAARRDLDDSAFTRAALALLRASRVEIWGCGASFAAARHLEQALLGICRGVAARDDGAMQALAAATLDGDAAALCLSRSGADRDVLAAARIAASAGATVVAITLPGSPLAAIATIGVACQAAHDKAAADPLPLLQLALAEVLCRTAASLAPPATAARAERIAAARLSHRVEA